MPPKCQVCKKSTPSYGVSKTYTHCAKCADKKTMTARPMSGIMVCITCRELGISKKGTYGIDKKIRYCFDHKTSNMADIVHKFCNEPDCKIRPSFGLEDGFALRCIKHKTIEMYNVISKHCSEPDCKTHPCFGLKEGIAVRCVKHKTIDMYDVVNKRCSEPNCKVQPNFGYKDGLSLKCAKHKTFEMLDIISKKCLELGCKTQPSFGLGDGIALYCVKHKTREMSNVISKFCAELDCKVQPWFGSKDGIALYCVKHKTKEMYDVKSKFCSALDCKTQPSFGLEDGISLYCVKHKTREMYDVKSKFCSVLDCKTRATQKYEGYCFQCYRIKYPDALLTRNFKNKEDAVVKDLRTYFPNETFVSDRPIFGGKTLLRPDIYYNRITHGVIVEIDEHQHAGYINDDERTLTLREDAKKPIYIVRFNPDHYYVGTNRIPSCWKDGKIVDQAAWNNRLDDLLDQVEKLFALVPEASITVFHLFYNAAA